MKTLPIAIATLLTSSLFFGTANAAAPVETTEQVVSFADLDLSQDVDAEKLYRRITAAAREVCLTPGVLQLVRLPRMRDCAERATAQAVADVNAPLLTRYHSARRGTAYEAEVIALAPRDTQRDE